MVFPSGVFTSNEIYSLGPLSTDQDLVARIFLLIIGIVAACATWTAFRVAWAYQTATSGGVENLRRASRILPDEPRFHVLRAHSESGEAAAAELYQSIRLAPRNSHAWTALGVKHELAGRSDEALEAYRQAARFDRGAAPRAMLANFSFRAGRVEDFWFWTRAAMDVPEARIDGLLTLCERLSPDGTQTWSTLIASRPTLWASYLSYWLARNQFVPGRAPAAHLAAIAQRSHVPDLLYYVDFELLFGDPGIAAGCWNQLAARRLVPYDPLRADSGPWLTNRALDHKPLNRAFDWRIQAGHGFALALTGQPRELRIEMTGEQRSTTDLFQQFLWLKPGAKYRFRFDARLTDFPRASGLSWIVGTTRAPVRTVAATPVAAVDWAHYDVEFVCPRDALPLRIVLRYQGPTAAWHALGVARFRSLDLVGAEGGSR